MFFDLNIDKILDLWTISDAIREFIANALDEHLLINEKRSIEIKKINDYWIIKDYGRGLQLENFTFNENLDKKNNSHCIGNFGFGLKDAIGYLFNKNIDLEIYTKKNKFTFINKEKLNTNIKTIHVLMEKNTEPNIDYGTYIKLYVNDADMDNAKQRFIQFNNSLLLDSNEYGEIYNKNDNEISKIYVNGLCLANDENFIFSYNIKILNTALRNSLNRERKNLSKQSFIKSIINIIKNIDKNGPNYDIIRKKFIQLASTNTGEFSRKEIRTEIFFDKPIPAKNTFFDLNIDKILEDWTISDAIREFISNALDEHLLVGELRPISIEKHNDFWTIKDYGRGIKLENFIFNENNEKKTNSQCIGNFGYGLKDAIGYFFNKKINLEIYTRKNKFTFVNKEKTDMHIKTIHVCVENLYETDTEYGTCVKLYVSDTDMENAKARFIQFSNNTLLESNEYGEIYDKKENESAKIYINGLCLGYDDTFVFSYNIKILNASLRTALNRERKNISKQVFIKSIINIIKNIDKTSSN